jgi:hypothetical protein
MVTLQRTNDSFREEEDNQDEEDTEDKQPSFKGRMQNMSSWENILGKILKVGQEGMGKHQESRAGESAVQRSHSSYDDHKKDFKHDRNTED